jgi:hypothetical protein
VIDGRATLEALVEHALEYKKARILFDLDETLASGRPLPCNLPKPHRLIG